MIQGCICSLLCLGPRLTLHLSAREEQRGPSRILPHKILPSRSSRGLREKTNKLLPSESYVNTMFEMAKKVRGVEEADITRVAWSSQHTRGISDRSRARAGHHRPGHSKAWERLMIDSVPKQVGPWHERVPSQGVEYFGELALEEQQSRSRRRGRTTED